GPTQLLLVQELAPLTRNQQPLPLVLKNLPSGSHDLLSSFARTYLARSFGKRIPRFLFGCVGNLLLQLPHRVIEFVLLLEGNQIAVRLADLLLVIRHSKFTPVTKWQCGSEHCEVIGKPRHAKSMPIVILRKEIGRPDKRCPPLAA